MVSNIFVNLPVSDLGRSIDFYTSLGFTTDPNFSDDNGASVRLGDDIYVMLLTHGHFSRFTDKPIADLSAHAASINAVGVESPEEVDRLADAAVGAGATEGAPQDYGWMRSRAFADPDGHLWEVLWMDPIAQTGDWAAVAEKYPSASGPDAS